MRLLADEHIDIAIVRWLRAAGHDVIAVAEMLAGASDRELVNLASQDQRIILTRDRDFGELVFRHRLDCPGIVMLRHYAPTSAERLRAFSAMWPRIESQCEGALLVVTATTTRRRPIPGP